MTVNVLTAAGCAVTWLSAMGLTWWLIERPERPRRRWWRERLPGTLTWVLA